LDHGKSRIAEIRHREPQKIGAGLEIGIENGNHLTSGGFQPLGQGACFIAFTIRTMQIAYVESQGVITLDAIAGDFLVLIRGIIEHLYLEQVRRIIQVRDGFDQPLDDVAIVVDRKVYSYVGPIDHGSVLDGDVGVVTGTTIAPAIALWPVW